MPGRLGSLGSLLGEVLAARQFAGTLSRQRTPVITDRASILFSATPTNAVNVSASQKFHTLRSPWHNQVKPDGNASRRGDPHAAAPVGFLNLAGAHFPRSHPCLKTKTAYNLHQ